MVAVIIAGIFALRWWINTEKGRLGWDAFKMQPPIFGALTHKAVLARFASTLSSLLQSGVPAMEALDIVSSASGNQVMAEAVVDIKAAVREGQSFAEPMKPPRDLHPAHDPDGRGRVSRPVPSTRCSSARRTSTWARSTRRSTT